MPAGFQIHGMLLRIIDDVVDCGRFNNARALRAPLVASLAALGNTGWAGFRLNHFGLFSTAGRIVRVKERNWCGAITQIGLKCPERTAGWGIDGIDATQKTCERIGVSLEA